MQPLWHIRHGESAGSRSGQHTGRADIPLTGAFEGGTTPEIQQECPGWNIWTGPTPGRETPEQVGARANRFIARVSDVDGDVAAFAHGHLLRILAWNESHDLVEAP